MAKKIVINSEKGKKKEEGKRNREQIEPRESRVYLIPNIFIITLNINELNVPIKDCQNG